MKFNGLILGLLLALGCTQSTPVETENENEHFRFSERSPASLEMDTAMLRELTSRIEQQFFPNIHSILVAKDGHLVFEEYFSGNDQNYGRDIGLIHHSDSTLHDLRSITKSIVSLAVGIALKDGLIKSVNQPIAEFFPDIEFNSLKKSWTLEHFLTMTTGLQWNERVPYDHPENDEIQMTYSDDPIQYVFSKRLENNPGTTFNYNGGATQVLAKIVEKTAGMPIDQFVKTRLFHPLGITGYEWNKFSAWNGADEFAAPSGLRLKSRDLLKIGLLYRNYGTWNDQEILTEKWVRESFSKKIEFPSDVTSGNDAYGFQFWMWPDNLLNTEIQIVAANGNGGQNIFWDLKNDLIIVTTAGNYNKWDIENDSYAILRKYIYPALAEII